MSSWRKYADLLVVIVCLVSALSFLGSRDIEEIRERRLAGTAADVYDHGRWLLPELEGKPRYLKPPFADWLAVTSMRLFGRNEFAFRLPFALAGLGAIFVAWSLARRLFDAETGRAAALMLATTAYFVSECHSPSQDLMLTFFASLALLLWWNWQRDGRASRLWGFYLALAAACLFKGPVALSIVGIPIALELWASRHWRVVLRMQPWWGLLLVVALAAVWPLAVWMQDHDFFAKLAADMKLSLVEPGKHSRWSHIGNWPWFSFPWSVLGIGALVLPLFRRALPEWPRLRFCYFWLVGNFVFFATWAMQPMHYLLPVAVPLAVIEAALLQRLARTIRSVHANRRARAAVMWLALCFVGFAIGTAGFLYRKASVGIWPSVAVGVGLSIPALLGVWRVLAKPEFAFRLFIVTGVLCVTVISGWFEPAISARKSVASFAKEIATAVPPTAPVYFSDTKEAVPFYAPRDFRRLAGTNATALVELRAGYWLTSRSRYQDILKSTGGRLMFDVQLDQKSHKDSGEDLLVVRFQPSN